MLKSISFLLDTGCQRTQISYNDVLNLGIPYALLPDGGPSKMINGTVPTKIHPSCGLSFVLQDNKSLITEMFPEMLLHNPTFTNPTEYKRIMTIPSLLGLDFIGRYKLTLQGSYAILEK